MTELYPGLSEGELELARIFFPNALKRADAFFKDGGRLVHYTTAEVAVSIIENQEIWMRNASTMNDWSEVEHGLTCLQGAWDDDSAAGFKSEFDSIFPGIIRELEDLFNSWQQDFRTNTYLTCLSEHCKSEDKTGRLSMWRAYGGQNGVALVLNSTPFRTSSDELGANTSPVEYWDEVGFKANFHDLLSGLQVNASQLALAPKETVFGYLFEAFKSLALCTKHPGFSEEREWRIVYSSSKESPAIRSGIRVVRGVPQLIQKIPLVNKPDLGLFEADIPNLLDRIIIGPTDHPLVMYHAFVDLLHRSGVNDPQTKVVMSDIPLRY